MASWALPTSMLSHARQVGVAIQDRARTLGGRPIRVDTEEIITGRAALLGLDPPTRISSGGASRLLECQDGWCALTLSRADDVDAVPALLEVSEVNDPWEALAAAAATAPAADFVARARLLDMPAAVLGETPAGDPNIVQHNGTSASAITDLLVVDLSSMWAGPLCGRLLAAAGATVVKVETRSRPDGTRGGNRAFLDWMNAGKLCYSGDFGQLLRAADVVIEGSRPAALARRGLGADDMPARPGRVWVRVSGYGRAHPDRVAFGDDAAVAGGLVGSRAGWSLGQASLREDGPVFCGDAVADPLAGLAATATVLDALVSGGGVVVDVSMAAVAATYAALPPAGIALCEPRRPVVDGRAHELGADNARVRELIDARLVGC